MDTFEIIGQISPLRPGSSLPIFSSTISCGFPSPAEDFIEDMTSLDCIAVANPPATFLLKVGGDSMTGVGIYPGDIIVVDRSRKPVSRSIVIAIYDGEFTCKRLIFDKDSVLLLPENPKYSPIIIRDLDDLVIWGLCTFNLHRLSEI